MPDFDSEEFIQQYKTYGMTFTKKGTLINSGDIPQWNTNKELVPSGLTISGISGSIKLDDLAAPDDNTDLNASIFKHGLLPKLGGGTVNFLRADGTWNRPPSSKLFVLTTSESRSIDGDFVNSYTIPSNTLAIGDMIKVILSGQVTSDAGGGTVRLHFKFGVSGIELRTTSRTINVSERWYIEAIGTVRDIGVGGNVYWTGNSIFGNPSTGGSALTDTHSAPANTTGGLILEANVDFSISDGSNTVTLDTFIVELLA